MNLYLAYISYHIPDLILGGGGGGGGGGAGGFTVQDRKFNLHVASIVAT